MEKNVNISKAHINDWETSIITTDSSKSNFTSASIKTNVVMSSLASVPTATSLETNIQDDIKVARKDSWSLPELHDSSLPWSELTTSGRVFWVLWIVFRLILIFAFLYMFICSLDVLSSAFRLLGGKAAGQVLSNSVAISNPIGGLMLGILVTVLVQSSSTSTSIVVSMVSARVLTVDNAIYIVMGANIGTTITNTIVAVGHATDRGDFKRAFAAATVHDMFNWFTVVLFLPLEVISGYLFYLTEFITADLTYDPNRTDNPEFLKAITTPFTDKIVKLSSSKIRQIALGQNVSGSLITKGDHLFNGWSGTDALAGTILLISSLVGLCICLLLLVKLLSTLLSGTIAKVLQRTVNADLPAPCECLTGYLCILVGAGLTVLIQSSSIFTSMLTPLVGIGAIHIERMYPLTLGSNIGTTVTGIMAALASDTTGFRDSLQIALCHLLFNISGVLVWYPVPFLRKVPVKAAKQLGYIVHKHRWFALVYMLFFFFLLPLAVFGLILAGWKVFLGVGVPILAFILLVLLMNVLQHFAPFLLPLRLRSWKSMGIPKILRSLDPYDKIFEHARVSCIECKRKCWLRKPQTTPA